MFFSLGGPSCAEARPHVKVVVALQVKGKTRGTFTMPAAEVSDKAAIERYARESEVGKKALWQKEVKKIVVPPNGKIINFLC